MTADFEGIDLSIIGKTEEIITTLTFRNKASVGIRKIRREKAFTQAVDIIINSIDYTLAENFKANPPIQFYGYATLIMQDCQQISIPITSARQRLYYGFQPEAFRQWRHWIEFYQLYQLHRFNDINIEKLLANSQLDYTREKPQLAKTGWIELPIREVYIKLRENCQFKLEFTQWQPISFIDPINNVPIDGKSNQDDGDKDSGLPKDGIQPKQNLPSNPFGGNPPTSGLEDAGLSGFDLLDDSNLDSPDPSNGLSPEDEAAFGFFLRVDSLGRYINFGNGAMIEGRFYFLVANGTTGATDTLIQEGDTAAGFSSVWRINAVPNGDIVSPNAAYLSASFSIVRSANLPTDGYFRPV